MVARLGIDIGGSGIKGAPVDLDSGTLVKERLRIETPQPSHPEAVVASVRRVMEAFPEVTGPIGCTFPAIIISGQVISASNIDDSWLGHRRRRSILGRVWPSGVGGQRCRRSRCGRGPDRSGGRTGRGRHRPHAGDRDRIGAAAHNANLVPNTELGHLELGGQVIEKVASNRARKQGQLSFETWAGRLNDYLAHLERLFSPDLFVIGGGISKRFGEFGPHLLTRTEIVPAVLRNEAGIVGAAMCAAGSR